MAAITLTALLKSTAFEACAVLAFKLSRWLWYHLTTVRPSRIAAVLIVAGLCGVFLVTPVTFVFWWLAVVLIHADMVEGRMQCATT